MSFVRNIIDNKKISFIEFSLFNFIIIIHKINNISHYVIIVSLKFLNELDKDLSMNIREIQKLR